MSVHPFIKVDKATFFKFAQSHDGRCEFVRGRIVMHAGGTRRHSMVARNFLVGLMQRLDQAKWHALGSDLAIDVGDTVRYPDVLVEPAGADLMSLTAAEPALAIEVLSPSSEERDLDVKAHEYLRVASLHAYIVASQDEPLCLVWLRGDDGTFPAEPVEFKGHTAVIRIPALGVEIALAAVYRGIC